MESAQEEGTAEAVTYVLERLALNGCETYWQGLKGVVDAPWLVVAA